MAPGSRRLPSLSALQAFDRVARLGGVTRAAADLGTSQSAVSRHLKQLERELGAPLFARDGRGVVLTQEGQAYWEAVGPALEALRAAGERVRRSDGAVTIACTHEVSHLLLMPRYAALRRALTRGGRREAPLRILTCEYEAAPAMVDAGADIIFEYRARSGVSRAEAALASAFEPGAAAILSEAIAPAASPALLERRPALRDAPPETWRGVRRLALTKRNSGWATWEDWFAGAGAAPPSASAETFDNYVYALEAAARGEGLVLAWRGFADAYLNNGSLVRLSPDWWFSGRTLYARLTAHGASNERAGVCLRFLADALSRETAAAPGSAGL